MALVERYLLIWIHWEELILKMKKLGKVSFDLKSGIEVLSKLCVFLPESHTTEHERVGGLRLMTFMIYLSDVEAGGHTVFPQPGISVKPIAGSALFWFNVGTQHNYDSRMRHLGCPVLHGNKWIANKWIKWLPNFKSHPCLLRDNHFSVIN